MTKVDSYYERHLTYKELTRLVNKFEIIDYTEKIVFSPFSYNAYYMLHPGSLTQNVAKIVVKLFYPLFPTYIWVLRKNA